MADTPQIGMQELMMDPEVLAYLQATSTFAPDPVSFDQYSQEFAESFAVTREDGVCTIRMHSAGDSAVFGTAHHEGWGRLLQYVGDDMENEIVIITGTGEDFVRPVPDKIIQLAKSRQQGDMSAIMNQQFGLYFEGIKLARNVVECLNVPTIGVINGPAGTMSMLATLCDITICSDDATFEEAHFVDNLVPADGSMQAYAGLMGIKRTAYTCYMHEVIDAQKALEYGLVNEVVPKDKVYERAQEIAAHLMRSSKQVRNVTHMVLKEYYRTMVDNMAMQFGTEAWAVPLHTSLNA